MKKVITLLMFLLLCFYAWSSEVREIKGRVTGDGKPLSGVVVTDGDNFSVTDKTGRYKLNVSKKGDLSISPLHPAIMLR